MGEGVEGVERGRGCLRGGSKGARGQEGVNIRQQVKGKVGSRY